MYTETEEDMVLSTEISEKRKKLFLFILDAVIFGLVVSALSWVFQILVPFSYVLIILALAIFFLLLSGWITFKLTVAPTRLKDTVSCCLIQDMKEGTVVILFPNWYEFSVVAAKAFKMIGDQKPEYKDKLKTAINLEDKVLRDFGIFAIIEWLTKLSTITISFSGYRRTAPRVIPEGIETGKLPKELMEKNVFLSNIEPMLPINIPKVQVENGTVVLNKPPMKISIDMNFHSWRKGLDLRIQHVLNISDKEQKNYGTIAGQIRFDAEFKWWSIFSRKADKYYTLASEMLENLRCNYGWSEYIEDLKESLYWKHTFNI
jgi:hypothetical protein